MKILLDTHILLWALYQSRSLPDLAGSMIADRNCEIYCSVISLWEIALKHQKHPERLPVSGKIAMADSIRAGYSFAELSYRHVLELESLNKANGKDTSSDPFDRMLVAQAKSDGMVLLTHDKKMQGLGEPVVKYV